MIFTYFPWFLHLCFHDFSSISRGFPSHFPAFPGDFWPRNPDLPMRREDWLRERILALAQINRTEYIVLEMTAVRCPMVSPVSGGNGPFVKGPGEEVVLEETCDIWCIYINIYSYIYHLSIDGNHGSYICPLIYIVIYYMGRVDIYIYGYVYICM